MKRTTEASLVFGSEQNALLVDAIRAGRGPELELVEPRFSGAAIRLPRFDSLAEDLSAFANANGSAVVCGVDAESGEIVGIPIERLDAVENVILDACDGGHIRRNRDCGLTSKGAGAACALHVVATHRPDFLIEEDGASAARKRYLKENAAEAKAALEKEMVRRERKAAKAGAEEGEDGVESGDPDEDSC